MPGNIQGGDITVTEPTVTGGILNIGHIFISQEKDRLLEHLRVTDPRGDKARIIRTAGTILEDSYSWFLGSEIFTKWRDNDESVLWLSGNPGKGKTILLCAAIEAFQKIDPPVNVSFFFCQATNDRLNTPTAALRGLIYLLARQQESLESHIRKKYDEAGQPLFEDQNAWDALSEILVNMLKDPGLKKTYLIIDALDECKFKELPHLLQFIKQNMSPIVKWVISSRHDPSISQRISTYPSLASLNLEDEHHAKHVSNAVQHYIDDRLSKLNPIKDEPGLHRELHEVMQEKAQGTFLWVALVVKELETADEWDMVKVVKETPEDLNQVYARMMQQIMLLPRQNPELCRLTLKAAAAAFRPLHLDELRILAGLPEAITQRPKYIEKVVKLCRCFITIEDGLLYIVHQTARDFLLKDLFGIEKDQDEGKEISDTVAVSQGGIKGQHGAMLSRSLKAMSITLRRDIYGLKDPGHSIDLVNTPDIKPLAAVSYSCIYWINHLTSSGGPEDDLVQVDEFLRKNYIYWLESLSLLKNVPQGVTSLMDLNAFLQNRLAREHIYSSALIFSPAGSTIRSLFSKDLSDSVAIPPMLRDTWSSCSQILEGHETEIGSLTVSSDNQLAATGSHDLTIKVWDLNTGSLVHTLEGHTDIVNNLVFSSTRRYLLSVSTNPLSPFAYNTIKFWDLETAICVWTRVGSITLDRTAFLPDGRCAIVSPDTDTVQIWDPAVQRYTRTLETDKRLIRFIACSPNNRWLAASIFPGSSWPVHIYALETGERKVIEFECARFAVFSPDSCSIAATSYSSVEIRDVATGDLTLRLEGHDLPVEFIAFSPDGRRMVSVSNEKQGREHQLKAWNLRNGSCIWTLIGIAFSPETISLSSDSKWVACVHDYMSIMVASLDNDSNRLLQGHVNLVSQAIFSPDGRWLASSSGDTTIKLWDTKTWACAHTLIGHTGSINSIQFLPDSYRLVSASVDSTARVWDLKELNGTTTEIDIPAGNGASWVNSPTYSPNGHQIMAASGLAIYIWEPRMDRTPIMLRGHTSWINCVKYSPNGHRVASASDDKTLKVWDPTNGSCVSTLTGHSSWVSCLAFSPDGRTLVSGSHDNTARMWDVTKGKCIRTLQGHSWGVNSVAFSPKGNSWVASGSSDHSVRVWDIKTGDCIHILQGHNSPVRFVAISSNGQWLVSTSQGTARIWDPATGECTLKLEHHDSTFISLSSNCCWLASVKNNQVQIWDLSEKKCIRTINAKTSSVTCAVFSPDTKSLAAINRTQTEIISTVYVWDLTQKSSRSFEGTDLDSVLFSPNNRQLLIGSSNQSSLETRGPDMDIIERFYLCCGFEHIPLVAGCRQGYEIYRLSLDYRWVTKNGVNHLALPSEYRPSNPEQIISINSSTVVIRCSSGRLMIIGFVSDESATKQARDDWNYHYGRYR
ncbi:beta transducin-like protein [Fusarium avenaceum]|nr:beta transducin-like protein [Fusarium avenaceum]